MRYVRYIGLAHIRQITAQDWRSVGINGDAVAWSAYNGFAVPLDALTEDQLQKAIYNDPEFVITGEGDDQNEEFVPKPQTSDMTPSALQQVTEAPADVLGWANGGDLASTADSGPSAAPGGAAPTTTGAATGSGGGGETPGTTVH
jgi:hypothetical protein